MAADPILVRVGRRFRASPERVFDAFLDPKTAGRFMFSTPEGEMVRAEIDARVGGRYVFTDRRGGEEVEHFGEYLEIDRPRRLVFTFSVGRDSTEADRVSLEVTPLETGCEVSLTHETDPEWAEYVDRTAAAWSGMLDGLAASIGEAA
jgi:uncharacterized protein YndB with AHSA1/START domain